ncbi:MAG: class I SAM-dependent methyltransferase [Nitrosopumilus sp.]
MKPEILDIFDSDFEWFGPDKQNEERMVLLRTIELASQLKDYSWFVELGTFKGINARNFVVALEKLQKPSLFASVDFNPFNKRLHFYPKEEWHNRMLTSTKYCNPQFIEGKTVDRYDTFRDNTIAWLFVDACHCFECVRDEIELYTPKVMSGGYMIFHDTATAQNEQWVTHNPPRNYGVTKAINESKTLRDNFTLIHNLAKGHGTQVWKKK